MEEGGAFQKGPETGRSQETAKAKVATTKPEKPRNQARDKVRRNSLFKVR